MVDPERFLEALEEWLPPIREVYKENMARLYEGPLGDFPDTRAQEAADIGAKLAVLNDLHTEITGIVSEIEMKRSEDSENE